MDKIEKKIEELNNNVPPAFDVKKEIVPEKPKKAFSWTGFLSKMTFFLMVGIMMIFMFWTSKASTPDNSMMVMFLTLSVLANCFIIIIMFGTGIGISILTRFFNRFRYKSGKYSNSLYLSKAGVLIEKFTKKEAETGHFVIDSLKYVSNPRLLFNFKGIPTYFHKEGTPAPIDLFDDELAVDLSCQELDVVMNASHAFDFKQWLDKNKGTLIILMFVMVAACAVAAYFGYSSFSMLRDGNYAAVDVVCTNLPKAEVIQQSLGGV